MLNPEAPAFVPSHSLQPCNCCWASDENASVEANEYLTEQELEELEATDEWVRLVAHLDELEHDHLVALALSYAPQQRVSEIERKYAKASKPLQRPHSVRHFKVRAKGLVKRSS